MIVIVTLLGAFLTWYGYRDWMRPERRKHTPNVVQDGAYLAWTDDPEDADAPVR